MENGAISSSPPSNAGGLLPPPLTPSMSWIFVHPFFVAPPQNQLWLTQNTFSCALRQLHGFTSTLICSLDWTVFLLFDWLEWIFWFYENRCNLTYTMEFAKVWAASISLCYLRAFPDFNLYTLLSLKFLCVEMSVFSLLMDHSYQESIACANLKAWAIFSFFFLIFFLKATTKNTKLKEASQNIILWFF